MTALTFDQLRQQFPITRKKTYLFNGNICPCAQPVREAMSQFLTQWSEHGDDCWALGIESFTQAKTLFAELINTSADNIAGIGNTTTGINMAARMIQPTKGQNVVVTDLEHMSDVYPWLALKREGVEVRYVPAHDGRIDIAEFAATVDDNTAAICISHVTMGSGYRFDLETICQIARAHGAATVVDAAQSAGAVPIDVTRCPVDIIAAPTFKWLLGPLGAGFLYVCPQLIQSCDPPLPGWFGVSNPAENDLRHMQWHTSAHKFERGVPSAISYVGAAAGLRLLQQVGYHNVYDRIEELATYLHNRLVEMGITVHTPADPAHRAGIVAIKVPDREQLWSKLQNAGIHVGNWLGYLRIDTACYNTTDELDRLLEHLHSFSKAAALER